MVKLKQKQFDVLIVGGGVVYGSLEVGLSREAAEDRANDEAFQGNYRYVVAPTGDYKAGDTYDVPDEEEE